MEAQLQSHVGIGDFPRGSESEDFEMWDRGRRESRLGGQAHQPPLRVRSRRRARPPLLALQTGRGFQELADEAIGDLPKKY